MRSLLLEVFLIAPSNSCIPSAGLEPESCRRMACDSQSASASRSSSSFRVDDAGDRVYLFFLTPVSRVPAWVALRLDLLMAVGPGVPGPFGVHPGVVPRRPASHVPVARPIAGTARRGEGRVPVDNVAVDKLFPRRDIFHGRVALSDVPLELGAGRLASECRVASRRSLLISVIDATRERLGVHTSVGGAF